MENWIISNFLLLFKENEIIIYEIYIFIAEVLSQIKWLDNNIVNYVKDEEWKILRALFLERMGKMAKMLTIQFSWNETKYIQIILNKIDDKIEKELSFNLFELVKDDLNKMDFGVLVVGAPVTKEQVIKLSGLVMNTLEMSMERRRELKQKIEGRMHSY